MQTFGSTNSNQRMSFSTGYDFHTIAMQVLYLLLFTGIVHSETCNAGKHYQQLHTVSRALPGFSFSACFIQIQ